MSNHDRLEPPLLVDGDPGAVEIVSLWKSFNHESVGISLLPDIFTDAEDWGILMADILINAVSAQKQIFGVDEKEYCRKALEGMRDRIKTIGITVEGGVYGHLTNLIDDRQDNVRARQVKSIVRWLRRVAYHLEGWALPHRSPPSA